MEWVKNIRIPGVIWALLLVAVAWFLAANFPSEVWYPIIIIVITALVKAIEVRLVDQLPPSPPPVITSDAPQMRSMASAESRTEGVKQDRMRRWLAG